MLIYIYCLTFQNLKLSLSGTDVGDSRAANNGHAVASSGHHAMPSPLTPLHARLRAAVQKPVQVGYHVVCAVALYFTDIILVPSHNCVVLVH